MARAKSGPWTSQVVILSVPPPPTIITGASGFIGRELVRQLRLRPNAGQILFIDTSAAADSEAGITHTVAADGTRREFSSLKECTLVHLAWCPPLRDQFSTHARQVELLAGLLDRHSTSITKIIALGSAEEYGASTGVLKEENASINELSPYGWGKSAARILVDSWCKLNGKNALWLRPFLVYGEGQQGNMAIPYAVRKAVHRETAEFSAGTQARDFIHVEDVCRGILRALEVPWTGFNLANLGTGIGTPMRDALTQVSRLFDAPELFRFGVVPMRPGEPMVQVAATDNAAKLLGFSAQISLTEGLYRMKEFSTRTTNAT